MNRYNHSKVQDAVLQLCVHGTIECCNVQIVNMTRSPAPMMLFWIWYSESEHNLGLWKRGWHIVVDSDGRRSLCNSTVHCQ